MRRRIDIACGLTVRPEVAFLDEPTTGLDPRSRQSIWELIARFKSAGITTLLTTQYLEEADALSDRIIMIDSGSIIAEGTVDELKKRTGSGYCEIVPKDPADLPAIATALTPMLPDEARAAMSLDVDRLTVPAFDGPTPLSRRSACSTAAGIALTDVALRRPSLDDVFFALTAVSRIHDLLDIAAAEPVGTSAVVGAHRSRGRADVPQRRTADSDFAVGGLHGKLLHPVEGCHDPCSWTVATRSTSCLRSSCRPCISLRCPPL